MKKLGDRFALVESRVDSMEASLGDRFKLVEESTNNLVEWQPGVDSAVADLTSKISAVDDISGKLIALSSKLDRVVLDLLPAGSGILPNPVAAAAHPPAGNPAVGPDEHRIENRYREPGFGSVTTITHLPVKGTSPSHPPPIKLPSRTPPFELSSRIPEPRQFSTIVFRVPLGRPCTPPLANYPKFLFPSSLVRIPSCGSLDLNATLTCTG
jgi:hypothetical protein